MAKLATGIPGFDEILKGGINENSSVLITGAPGTGKSVLCLQYIYEGAKRGEGGVYITSEEDVTSLRKNAKSLDMDLEKYEKEGKIYIVQQSISNKKLISIATPVDIIKKDNIKRVVMDSLTLFEYTHVAGDYDYRKEVVEFLKLMKEFKVTLLATSEKSVTNLNIFKYDTEDFLFNGLVVMSKVRKASIFERCLYVAKMRGQDHLMDIFPFTIGLGGIKIFTKQVPFSLIDIDSGKFEK